MSDRSLSHGDAGCSGVLIIERKRYPCPCGGPQERMRYILSDLIAELRTYNTTMGGRLPQSDPDLAALVDRAEARLREASGGE